MICTCPSLVQNADSRIPTKCLNSVKGAYVEDDIEENSRGS